MICGCQALLPKSVQIPLCYNQTDIPLGYGGYADVWRGEYQGCTVAVKVLRVFLMSNLDKTTHVSYQGGYPGPCRSADRTRPEILQGSHAMENSSPSEHIAAVGSIDG